MLISALIIFNVEPDSFTTFFDAIYWATVSLTTVGYLATFGDFRFVINEISEEEMESFIEMSESKFPYLRYSYLYNCFLWYETRATGWDYKKKQDEWWGAAVRKKRV